MADNYDFKLDGGRIVVTEGQWNVCQVSTKITDFQKGKNAGETLEEFLKRHGGGNRAIDYLSKCYKEYRTGVA